MIATNVQQNYIQLFSVAILLADSQINDKTLNINAALHTEEKI